MIGQAPGSILQFLYLKERLDHLKKEGVKTFIEVGSGNGSVSRVLLREGLKGKAYDLNEGACMNNRSLNKNFIDQGKYSVTCGDFMSSPTDIQVDLIISCMVIEHMPDDILVKYFEKCRAVIRNGGYVLTLVPSGMQFWGVEDEIAGHMKRYEYHDFEVLASRFNLRLNHVRGLTYPFSNMVLGLSNRLVAKGELDQLNRTQQEKTIYTGNRDVKFKTSFPTILNIVLNPVVMYPWHILQKLFSKSSKSMVIYCELKA